MKGINLDIIMFFVNTLIFALLLFAIEKKYLARMIAALGRLLKSSSNVGSSYSIEPLDDDVENERKRVQSNPNDLLTVVNLQKHFGKFKAVQGISFGVHHGECFGFLGINGAGKTTSFK